MKTRNTQNIRGFSLIEMVVYISILSIVTAGLIVAIVSILSTFAHLKGYEEMAHTGTTVLERISRESRRAHTVDTGGSTFGVHPGVLSLGTTDLSNNPSTIIFSLSGGKVMVQQGTLNAPLSTGDVVISNLVFTPVFGTNTTGINIDLTVEKNIKGATSTKQFRTFVVLDG
jgi:prepilin-type N-terminal cleavage/methylation domain-containing protein